tara:strand:+ start:18 stop:416 length:399 start_codon:yes stop_codon:yes gene_type:complete
LGWSPTTDEIDQDRKGEIMENMLTSDIAKFGARERAILVELLEAWGRDGLPSDFYDEDVVPMFNMNSGYVFLTNADYQTAIMEDGKLVSHYFLPYGGLEGTLSELVEEFEKYGDSWHSDDVEAFNDIKSLDS